MLQKNKQINLKKILLPGFIFFSVFLLCAFHKDLTQKSLASSIANSTVISKQKKIDPGLPVRIKIPKIKADAGFEYVGITSDGAMGVPEGPAEVAWFDLGPRPGEIGNAVIAGHSGWKNGTPAVFDNLYKLKKGDKLSVTDGKGIVSSFVVRQIRKYDPNASASEVFNSNDNKAHLNLITCTGIWNYASKSHSERLVVFTDKEI